MSIDPNDALQRLSQVYACLDAATVDLPSDSRFAQALQRVIASAKDQDLASGQQFTLLPLLACQSAGGLPKQAVPVAAAWRALHIAAKLWDDVEDGDVAARPEQGAERARVINIATGMVALAQLALGSLALSHDPLAWQAMYQDFNRTILEVGAGQHDDLHHGPEVGLERYLALIAAKSGAAFALATRAGARCATEEISRIIQYDRFGYNVGIMIQIADDLAGFRRCLGHSDLTAARITLPVAYALEVASAQEKVRLKQMLAAAPQDQTQEFQAHQLISSLGAEAYLVVEMKRYQNRALAALADEVAADQPIEPLLSWLENLQIVL